MATAIKDWLDLSGRDVRARLAKELIALANYPGARQRALGRLTGAA